MPTNKFMPTDKITGARKIIESYHSEVHSGEMYEFHIESLTATAVTVINVHYKTGNKEVHIDAIRQAIGGRVQTVLYESPTIATIGSVLIQCRNKNRNYPDSPLMEIRTDTTFAITGTVIIGTTQILAAATNQNKTNSSVKDNVELILKPNTDYLAKTTFTATSIYTMDAIFYEED